MQNFNTKKFNEIKEESEAFYKSIVSVHCPYFQEEISFNSKGLEHLKFKKKNHARPLADQFIRFKILKIAPEVISTTKTIQGISEQKVFELVRSNNRSESVLVDAMYYEFVAIIRKIRVRVIIKQIGTSPKYFWSIIPFWKMNKETGKRKLHYGDPESN